MMWWLGIFRRPNGLAVGHNYEVGDSMVLTLGRSTCSQCSGVREWHLCVGGSMEAWGTAVKGLEFKVCDSSIAGVYKRPSSRCLWFLAMHPPEQQIGRTKMLFSRSLRASSLRYHQKRSICSPWGLQCPCWVQGEC